MKRVGVVEEDGRRVVQTGCSAAELGVRSKDLRGGSSTGQLLEKLEEVRLNRGRAIAVGREPATSLSKTGLCGVCACEELKRWRIGDSPAVRWVVFVSKCSEYCVKGKKSRECWCEG